MLSYHATARSEANDRPSTQKLRARYKRPNNRPNQNTNVLVLHSDEVLGLVPGILPVYIGVNWQYTRYQTILKVPYYCAKLVRLCFGSVVIQASKFLC